MKKQFKKSTPEKIAKILVLREKGWTYKKIAEELGIDHTSVIYWIKRKGVSSLDSKTNSIQEKIGQENLNEKIKEEEEQEKLKRKKEEENKKRKEICSFCGKKKKDIKWDRTNFCSLKCWYNANPVCSKSY